MNSSSVKEYLKKKEEMDKNTLVEIKKDIDNIFSLFSKGDESRTFLLKKDVEIPFTFYTDLFVKVFNFRPDQELSKDFEKYLHEKIDEYFTNKIEAPFKKLVKFKPI
jgi:hypothetical protein